MAIKVLLTERGQQLIADTKVLENSETGERVAYVMDEPRVLIYKRQEEDNLSLTFAPFCISSNDKEVTLAASYIVAVLEPREDVKAEYEKIHNPPQVNLDLTAELVEADKEEEKE